jgi:rRNA maturation endonuclease Nob1
MATVDKIHVERMARDPGRVHEVYWECDRCQRRVSHDAKFCDNCGSEFGETKDVTR